MIYHVFFEFALNLLDRFVVYIIIKLIFLSIHLELEFKLLQMCWNSFDFACSSSRLREVSWSLYLYIYIRMGMCVANVLCVLCVLFLDEYLIEHMYR
jgi:hypothetical protein